MADFAQTPEQLQQEIARLRQRISELEASSVPPPGETPQAGLFLAFEQNAGMLQTFLEELPDPIYAKDSNGRYRVVNTAFAKVIGLSAEKILGRDDWDLFAWDQARKNVQTDRQAMLGGAMMTFEETQPVDGRLRTFLTTKTPYRDRLGNVAGLICISRDVTERKQIIEALRQEKKLMRQYLEIAGVMILVLRPDGCVEMINRKGCEILGCEEPDILGKDWFERFIPSRVRHEVRSTFLRIMAGDVEAVEYYENYVLTLSGVERLISWRNALLRGNTGETVATISSGHDITDLREGELALRLSEVRYRDLFATMAQGVVCQDASGAVLMMNEAARRMLGLAVDQVSGADLAASRWDTVAEDGRALPPGEHPVAVALRTGREVRNVTLGIKGGGGIGCRWIRCAALPQFKPREETPSQVYVIFDDITDLKRAQDALSQSRDSMRELYQHSPAALHALDRDGRLLHVSDAWLQTLGYRVEDVIGRRILDFLALETRETYGAAVDETLRRTGSVRNVPCRLLRADGQGVECAMSAAAERAENGAVERTLAVLSCVDVEGRRNAEPDEMASRLRLLIEHSDDFFSLSDLEGRFLFLRVPSQYGIQGAECVGKTGAEVFGEETGRIYAEQARQVTEAGKPMTFETPLMLNGETVWLMNRVFPMSDERGRMTRIARICRDVTVYKNIEENWLAARHQTEQREKIRIGFLNCLSQDVYAAAGMLFSGVDMLLQTGLTDAQKGYATALRDGCDALMFLVEDGRGVAEWLASGRTVPPADFDFPALVSDILRLLRHKLAARDMDICCDWDSWGIGPLCGDLPRAHQQLLLLLNLALRLGGRGTVVLQVSGRKSADRLEDRREVRLKALVPPGAEGLGDPGELPEIQVLEFLAEAAGGEFFVGGLPDTGWELELSLLLHEGMLLTPERGGQGAPPLLLRDRRVACVHPEEPMRGALERMCRKLGLQVLPGAGDVPTLLRCVAKSDAAAPEIVVCHVGSADGDGGGLAHSIRTDARLTGVRLVAYAGYDPMWKSRKLRESGFDAALFKPADPVELEQTLLSLVREPGEDEAASGPAVPQSADALKGVRVLVVEDHPSNRRLMEYFLLACGCVADTAADGREALDKVFARPYDLCLMDLQVPGMDGFELTRRIRADSRTAALPVIAVTCAYDGATREDCRKAGMNDFLSKPVRLQTLRALMLRTLFPQKS